MNWVTVTGWKGQKLGRVRRLQQNPELWVIEGREAQMWSNSLDAMRELLEGKGVRYQVKTMMSHRYWTGLRWTEEREKGQVFADRETALRAAKKLDRDPHSWDRVVVVEWERNNWR